MLIEQLQYARLKRRTPTFINGRKEGIAHTAFKLIRIHSLEYVQIDGIII